MAPESLRISGPSSLFGEGDAHLGLNLPKVIGIRVPPAVLAHAGHIFSRKSRRLTHVQCTRKLCA
jgi:hypothetical protein